jgi:hypothetical protein
MTDESTPATPPSSAPAEQDVQAASPPEAPEPLPTEPDPLLFVYIAEQDSSDRNYESDSAEEDE